ncbi:MAG: carboxypeptidase regulatory-like domain-containing protein [Lachnospiraceae bacterium]|nr:carboxypeptidase regulatory-like domain-containing protein [Lachnospiraceae bacterium]
MGKKAFVIDVARCVGCYSCQTACKDEHCGNDWTPYAKPQPELGAFWLRLEEHTEGTVPKVRMHYIPRLCNHCDNPKCMAVCECHAITRHEDHDFVIIEPEKCCGCGKCSEACAYGAIYMNQELKIAQKCTGCAHLLDNGFDLPRCVEACPTEAMKFIDLEESAEETEGAVVLKPEEGCKPNVYYKNIPGRFIAGLVYDPVRKEIIEGAKCRLLTGGRRRETTTDLFGDFWFEDLPAGVHDLYIEAEGYAVKKLEGIRTQEGKSVNLGDIAMDPAEEESLPTAEEWEKIKEEVAMGKKTLYP